MPQRVRAALDFVYHCKYITDPGDDEEARELSPAEARVYHLALDVLARYFSCEMDYGDRPPRIDDAAAESNSVRK